mgnify:CR=1 FL=1
MTRRRRMSLAIALGLFAALAMFTDLRPMLLASSAAAGSTAVPAPDTDEPATTGVSSETAVLAGGCFWGVQGVFQHVKGVTRAESGYAGGAQQTANYETVSAGGTGHAESVRITCLLYTSPSPRDRG